MARCLLIRPPEEQRSTKNGARLTERILLPLCTFPLDALALPSNAQFGTSEPKESAGSQRGNCHCKLLFAVRCGWRLPASNTAAGCCTWRLCCCKSVGGKCFASQQRTARRACPAVQKKKKVPRRSIRKPEAVLVSVRVRKPSPEPAIKDSAAESKALLPACGEIIRT